MMSAGDKVKYNGKDSTVYFVINGDPLHQTSYAIQYQGRIIRAPASELKEIELDDAHSDS